MLASTMVASTNLFFFFFFFFLSQSKLLFLWLNFYQFLHCWFVQMSVSTKQIGTEIHCLLGSADRGQVSILTLLNLSATFNTLDNSILLARLHDVLGISGRACEWFPLYLSDRFQSVSVNDRVSWQKKLHYGVPRGSVLGPILFTLYTQPLSDIIPQS